MSEFRVGDVVKRMPSGTKGTVMEAGGTYVKVKFENDSKPWFFNKSGRAVGATGAVVYYLEKVGGSSVAGTTFLPDIELFEGARVYCVAFGKGTVDRLKGDKELGGLAAFVVFDKTGENEAFEIRPDHSILYDIGGNAFTIPGYTDEETMLYIIGKKEEAEEEETWIPRPFEHVLGRGESVDEWHPDIFLLYDENTGLYTCARYVYCEVRPYKEGE